jgi:hypothetical protein
MKLYPYHQRTKTIVMVRETKESWLTILTCPAHDRAEERGQGDEAVMRLPCRSPLQRRSLDYWLVEGNEACVVQDVLCWTGKPAVAPRGVR